MNTKRIIVLGFALMAATAAALLARQSWILRLHDERAGIPYGVALAAGAFLILPGTEIFRLAAGG